MKTVVLLYETCCIYEIVITNYFLQLCGHELVFATIDTGLCYYRRKTGYGSGKVFFECNLCTKRY